jgi:nitrite reductase (NO-forming)
MRDSPLLLLLLLLLGLTVAACRGVSAQAPPEALGSGSWQSESSGAGAPRVVFRWVLTDTEIAFTLSGRTAGWMAVGFAERARMKHMDTHLFWDQGHADMWASDRKQPDTDMELGGQDDLLAVACSREADDPEVLTCRWTRARETADAQFDYQFGEDALSVYLLWAVQEQAPVEVVRDESGRVSALSLEKHGGGDRGVALINLLTNSINNVDTELPALRDGHGWCMAIAWGVCALTAALLPRYGRVLGGWVWFIAHIVLAVLALLLSIAGFILTTVRQTQLGRTHFNSAHGVLGLMVFILAMIQPLIGLVSHFTFDKDRKRVSVVDRIHQAVGWILVPFAIATCYVGLDAHDMVNANLWIGFSVWLASVISFIGVMEVYRFRMGIDARRNARILPADTERSTKEDRAAAVKTHWTEWLAMAALVVLITAVFAVCFAAFVAVGRHEQASSGTGSYTPTVRHFELHALLSGYVQLGAITAAQAVNPTLEVLVGDTVEVELVNGEAMPHDWYVGEFGRGTAVLEEAGERGRVSFVAERAGTFRYWCTVPGHLESGMHGWLVVRAGPFDEVAAPQREEREVAAEAEVARGVRALPAGVGARAAGTVEVWLETREEVAWLDEGAGTSFTYFTYNGTVPGPMVRVRLGDTVVVHLNNRADSSMRHSVDFHAATGPGGGAAATQVEPGQTRSFRFRALHAGAFVYHCASPNVPAHIAKGMYGLLVVEPAGGLPAVDHELYVMQGELYTDLPRGAPGHALSHAGRTLAEDPTHVVLNGRPGALTGARAPVVAVGQTVRLFFGVGGPNLASSFHVIGEIFDRVYVEGGYASPPAVGLQTTTVAPGGATTVEMRMDVPGTYLIVDHALSRTFDKGALGAIVVEGAPQPDLYQEL